MNKRWMAIILMAVFVWNMAGTDAGKRTVRAAARQTVWQKKFSQYRYDETVNQLIFVKYQKRSKAAVYMYQKIDHKWKRILKCKGYVGKKGINKKKEGDMKTPSGTFGFTGAFGIKKNPGAKMNYTRVNKYLYWCGDKKYYNRLIDVKKKKHRCRGEHLIDYKPHYYYGMVLNYNPKHKYKKGSAIFLHCKGKQPYTAGCIAVSRKSMKKIIKNAEAGARICIYRK